MLKEEYIFLELDVSTKDEVLTFISHQAQKMNITDDEEKLYADLLREKVNFQLDYRMDSPFHTHEQKM